MNTTALRAWWQALPARDRSLVTLAALVLGAYLLWALALAPAWRTLRQAPAQLQSQEIQLQQMRQLAAEAQELRAQPALPAAAAAESLKAITTRLGPLVRLQLQGDRAVLTLQGLDGPQLRALLTEARGSARARALEAQLNRGPQGYSGTLVLGLGAGGG